MTVIQGDCRDVLKGFPENHFDSIVTDPPYELTSISKRYGKEGSAPAQKGTDGRYQRLSGGFMGKQWDATGIGYDPTFWQECLRVLKPGGHLIVFGGSRTHHRVWCAIEDAGFEVRDTLMWIFGSGFPKSLDVSKAIDKAAGAERGVVGVSTAGVRPGGKYGSPGMALSKEERNHPITTATTDLAKQWDGWGTALKPAAECIVLARKNLSEKTVAANVLKWGTGAINIDGCRVSVIGDKLNVKPASSGFNGNWKKNPEYGTVAAAGRWPANVITDGSDEVLSCFPNTKARGNQGQSKGGGGLYGHEDCLNGFGAGEEGSAARFFYTAKAHRSEREEGLEFESNRAITWDLEDHVLLELTEELYQLSKGISDDTSRSMENFSWSTVLFGKASMVRSQKDMMFIMSMVTKLITELKTSKFSQNSITRDFILDATKTLMVNGSNLAESVVIISRLMNSMQGKMELVLGASSAALKMLWQISERGKRGRASTHPTVKPVDLMRYLCRLVTPPGGHILDPFLGSGSTGVAAKFEDFEFTGIEKDPEYCQIAEKRLKVVVSRQERVTRKPRDHADDESEQATTQYKSRRLSRYAKMEENQ